MYQVHAIHDTGYTMLLLIHVYCCTCCIGNALERHAAQPVRRPSGVVGAANTRSLRPVPVYRICVRAYDMITHECSHPHLM